jgi:hypothetical protein
MSEPAATTLALVADESNAIQLANKLSQVNHKQLKFIIMDRPTEFNLPSYLRELKKAVSACVSLVDRDYCSAPPPPVRPTKFPCAARGAIC